MAPDCDRLANRGNSGWFLVAALHARAGTIVRGLAHAGENAASGAPLAGGRAADPTDHRGLAHGATGLDPDNAEASGDRPKATTGRRHDAGPSSIASMSELSN
jgi:hypothetical protein